MSERSATRPTRAEGIDVAFTVALGILGVVGFRTVFADAQELTVGVPAVLAGVAVGFTALKVRLPFLAGLAVTLVALFVLAGPIALRHRATAGFLPSPDASVALADAAITSWVDLLTSLPPAGRGGDHAAIPYLCGFLGAAATIALARHFRDRSFCVIPPTIVLVVSVLMGTKRPASLLLQGVVFAGVTIAWVSVRYQRERRINVATNSRSRLLAGAVLIGISAFGGTVIGPMLPGGGELDRYVLRQDVEPPFDPLTEPSPLAGYRNYSDQDRRTDEIVRVQGLPAGARIHIGIMDSYSGTEWRATGSGSVLAGEYLRVGAEIPADGLGLEQAVTVEMLRPHGVWVPLGGDVTGLAFRGDRAEQLDEEVRVSIETDAAAVPGGLRAGDQYRFTAEFTAPPSEDVLVETGLDGRYVGYAYDDPLQIPEVFVSRGADWVGEQPTEFAEVLAMAEGLIEEGAFSDGGPEANPPSPPGHSLRRLLDFIDTEQPFGNGEQFAAAMGLLAQSRDIPVRVAMGFVNRAGNDDITFRGEDIEAWVEVPVDGYGWVPIDVTPPEDKQPDPIRQPRSKTENPEPQPPPPTTVPPPTSIPNELEAEEPDPDEEKDDAAGIPAWAKFLVVAIGMPILLLVIPALVIIAIKRRRRRRRRRRGTPADQVAGSFSELVDGARDVGRFLPGRATRPELATAVGVTDAGTLASHADTAAFGPEESTEEDVEVAWATLVECERSLQSDLDRAQRLRSAVSVRSLRGQA